MGRPVQHKQKAIVLALLAAVFYALNVPASKLLLEHVGPLFMAALLYLGAGIGVGALALLRRNKREQSSRLSREDMPFVLGMIVLDIAAPILLMLGIREGTASNAALLGNFEIVATTIIALVLFHEAVTPRLWTAIAFIVAASIILSFEGEASLQFSRGSLFVLAATACWGLENNCTRKISSKDTYQIVVLKGIFSGLGAAGIALWAGEAVPSVSFMLAAMLLGFVAYGLSIFLYVRAQSVLGAAKTSAYYAVAPFVAAFLSFALLGEKLSASYLLAFALMLVGTVLVMADTLARRHTHTHSHTFVHVHDGVRHEHTITHSHEHQHYLGNELHKHGHVGTFLPAQSEHKDCAGSLRHAGETRSSETLS